MHSLHWVLLSLFSPLLLFHCSQGECFLPSHFALAAVQLGRVRHSNSSNFHSRQAKIHPCHQKDWSAMFRSFICSTLRSLVMEPKHFHFVAVPKVFFSRDHRPLDFDYQAKYSKNEIFQNDAISPFEIVFVTFRVFFSPGFCRDSC